MTDDLLAEREEAIALFERYGVLLTERESALFRYYYSCDLSLSEIAENEKISRAAVSDSVRKSLEKLQDYEAKLHLVATSAKEKALIKTITEGEEKEKAAALRELKEIIDHGI
jgi:predicted DNA-binding protein YlxM (UPF0122 family)